MLLVVAWDGASFELLDGWMGSGELPVIADLKRRGAWRRLRSTVPAVTFPAWSSFMTGATPGRHGVTDFTVRRGGDYAVHFVNASYRRLPSIWSMMSSAGQRVGVYAMPATYPAEPLDGIQVCGFDTPLGASGAAGFCHPPELADRLSERYGGLAVGGPPQTRIDEGWHERALRQMRETVRLRTRIVTDLLKEDRFDCFVVHYGESDTASHHFWQFHDSSSPFHRGGHTLGSSLREVYRELDAALGELLDAAGPDAEVMVLSDHGSGGSSDRVVFWNRWLADLGLLGFKDNAAASIPFSAVRKAVMRVLPGSLQPWLFARLRPAAAALESRARFAGIDWSRTRAYSEELNYYPSVWLNLRGRERAGVVSEAEAPGVLDEIATAALELRDPWDGHPVVSRVRRREELFSGPYAHRAPDLVFELAEPAGYSYCAASSRGGRERASLRRLVPAEMTGARGTLMSGTHRAMGMCVLAGARVTPGGFDDAGIEDAGATCLAMAGLEPGQSMDGRVWKEAVRLRDLAPSEPAPAEDPRPYTDEEESVVAERLRALGYLG